MTNTQNILLMKAGPYCGFSLEEIIKIKQKEEKAVGKFFWGYSGVFCRPQTVLAFLTHSRISGEKLKVLFTPTPSAFQATTTDKFQKYSLGGNSWKLLPKEVLLVGNKKRPHFALVCKNLKKVSYKINPDDYRVFRGALLDPNTSLNDYFRYRVDKACAGYYPGNLVRKKSVAISFDCELTEPYCVYIK